MAFFVNFNFILQISHVKTFKMRYTRCQYNNLILRYSLLHFMCGSIFYESDVSLKPCTSRPYCKLINFGSVCGHSSACHNRMQLNFQSCQLCWRWKIVLRYSKWKSGPRQLCRKHMVHQAGLKHNGVNFFLLNNS